MWQEVLSAVLILFAGKHVGIRGLYTKTYKKNEIENVWLRAVRGCSAFCFHFAAGSFVCDDAARFLLPEEPFR